MTGPAEPGSAEPGLVPVRLTVSRGGEDVPALLWRPADGQHDGQPTRRPLVLIGHGGGMHKQAPFVVRLAERLAGRLRFACLAIDLPLHGERTPPGERGLSPRQRRDRLGLDAWRERNDSATTQAVADWQAAIAAADAAGPVPYGPLGYLGLSMGTRFGIPLLAAQPRISAAVLGLFGHPAADPGAAFARAAQQVTVPVLFLQQWDDELFPRADCLTLFDLLASPGKTLHANPGGHMAVPRAEFEAAAVFLRRHLGAAGGSHDQAGDGPGGMR